MNGKNIIYFDNASTTFKSNSVIKSINYYYMNKNSNSIEVIMIYVIKLIKL